jgi:hypothetical protein
MLQRNVTSKIYFKACCLVFYFVAASASFNGFYDKWHFSEVDASGRNSKFQFEKMVDGTAYRPFVYRQMLPTIADWIDEAVPASIKTELFDYQSGPTAKINAFFESATAENRVYFFRYVVVYTGTLLFALLAVYAMRLACVALEVAEPAASLAPVVMILLIPYLQSLGGFFYDYPELAFFALAVWAAVRFRWGWVIPIVALGTWNKESFLLFVPTLYPFLRSRSSRAGAWLAMSVLGMVCLAVYLPTRAHFAHNPGGAVEMHWRDQLSFFLDIGNLTIGMEKTYGMEMFKAFSVLPLTLCTWMVCRAWRYLPRMVRSHGKIAAAINVPLYLIFCWPGELRDLSMLYIVLMLVLAYSLNEWCGSGAGPAGE